MESLGRVVGEDIDARRNIPPLDNSGMDGYAVRTADIEKASRDHSVRLEVIEDLPAGFHLSEDPERRAGHPDHDRSPHSEGRGHGRSCRRDPKKTGPLS